MPSLPHILLLLLGLATPSFSAKPKIPKDASLLSSIRTLTLHSSRLTTSRRTSPVPQLTCISGSGCKHYAIDVLRCTNSGSEYSPEDVSWTCQASLPEEFKLGSTEVVCEGYASPEDEWVLKGSCGVEYRLLLTEKGEEKYGSGSGEKGWWGEEGESYLDEGTGLGGKVFTFIFWAIFLGIVGLILYSVLFGAPNPNPNNPRALGYNGGGGGGGWGGGGGGDGDDYPSDPPPSYTPDDSSYRKPDPRSSSNTQSWRPGFWSGTAAGAAAAYAMNQTRGGRNDQQAQAGPSNWFGGGRQATAPSRGFGGYGGGESSSSPAPSSSRHESTGFGGTRRR